MIIFYGLQKEITEILMDSDFRVRPSQIFGKNLDPPPLNTRIQTPYFISKLYSPEIFRTASRWMFKFNRPPNNSHDRKREFVVAPWARSHNVGPGRHSPQQILCVTPGYALIVTHDAGILHVSTLHLQQLYFNIYIIYIYIYIILPLIFNMISF